MAKNKTDSKFAHFSLRFFDRYKSTFVVWIALLLAGLLSYGVWLSREGFPPIQVPIGVISGTFFVDDAETVDSRVAVPLTQSLLADERVESVETSASSNFFSAVVFFSDGVDNQGIEATFNEVRSKALLPDAVQANFSTVDPSKYLNEYDIMLSVYAKNGIELQALEGIASELATEIATDELVEDVEVISLFTTAQNPVSGQEETRQSNFGRIGLKQEGEVRFYESVSLGVNGTKPIDSIKLSDAVNQKIEELGRDGNLNERVGLINSADVAPTIKTQINSLQENVLTGLLAVSVVSLILITWRASLITALFIVSVIAVTMFILYLIGLTINTITLFGLVLSLGLFVDDATIIVEAIDAGRKPSARARDIVEKAVAKVASASFAGTFTTVLVFLPLVFVSGILGEFIRILPVTIIVALVVSLALSLTLIPFLAKFVLLRTKPKRPSPVARGEAWVAEKLGNLPLLLKTAPMKGYFISFVMLLISVGFIVGSFTFASRLSFNIFPPSKDSNTLQVEITFPPNTTIEEATDISAEVDSRLVEASDGELISSVYFNASERSATAIAELTPFTEREVTSLEILEKLEAFGDDFDSAKVQFNQLDPGPPAQEFPFRVQVFSEAPQPARQVADSIASFIEGSTVTRPTGSTAQITETNIANIGSVVRADGERFIEVQAAFDAEDTTALVQAAQELVEEEFTPETVRGIAGEEVNLAFDFGQESENQDSFASLTLVGPLSVLVMFILLAVQFRSLMQPLLIFMAIPFSFFGVFFGLYLTDNPISFFSLIGFFGLIGIAVNNTILLTDYANQERRTGLDLTNAISEATKKRFRPLIATSITTVAALTPLALTDPFWEPLAVTIIFGLLSSTLLVVLSFPYYYLLVEALRGWTKTRFATIYSRIRS